MQKHPQKMICKKGVLKSFARIAGKHLCQSIFFHKVASSAALVCNFFKEEGLAQLFSCGFWEIFENTIFTELL